MSNLQLLLKDIVPLNNNPDLPIAGVSVDSRAVQENYLFMACAGHQNDARKYIHAVAEKGVKVILYDNKDGFVTKSPTPADTLLFPVADLQKHVGTIAARFYGDPSAHLSVIGVTGTNGKTSSSHFIARALQMAGKKCGILGTLGMGFPDHLGPAGLTTPDAITLQRELAALKEQGAEAIAMEVSSHSLAQHRVDGIHFHTAIFTNLTRDHLDYHGNMLEYAKAKQRLFEQPSLQNAIVNLDDEYGRQFVAQMPKSVTVYGYTIANTASAVPTIRAENIRLHGKGFSAQIITPWGIGELQSHLLGRFNISNLLAVVAALNLQGVAFADSLRYVGALTTVPGRMQMLGGDKKPLFVVDYAHTPDALYQALSALREHCQGKLWCVFGCGGERDVGKRPMMADIAERYSDHVIVTDDNPRREYSQKIIADIVQGFRYPQQVTIIPDRRKAIAYAAQNAALNDVVFIAGKGHENYQIIGTEKLPYSDVEEVVAALQKNPQK
jgi:UDP-N-acetylmuramoyl-L-alanyl-D-glutamate--2,6-diaminopimelate ligase